MDKLQQLKTWLEDSIKHGGNNHHTLSCILYKIEQMEEFDKHIITKAREMEAEGTVWTPTP